MNPIELWNTTLNPETRNLLQVQYSKNEKKDQELIYTLMGNDVSLRKDFIVDNAINVADMKKEAKNNPYNVEEEKKKNPYNYC